MMHSSQVKEQSYKTQGGDYKTRTDRCESIESNNLLFLIILFIQLI